MTCISEFNGVASGAVQPWKTTAMFGVPLTNKTEQHRMEPLVGRFGHHRRLAEIFGFRQRDALTCEFISKGTFDESITHNRDSIPKALPLHDIEASLMDDQRYPDVDRAECAVHRQRPARFDQRGLPGGGSRHRVWH